MDVQYVDEVVGSKASAASSGLSNGSVLLLENVRFDKGLSLLLIFGCAFLADREREIATSSVLLIAARGLGYLQRLE